MGDELKLAKVMAACTTALIRAVGMHSENQDRLANGHTIAYDESAFLKVIEEEGISWNQVCEVLRGS